MIRPCVRASVRPCARAPVRPCQCASPCQCPRLSSGGVLHGVDSVRLHDRVT